MYGSIMFGEVPTLGNMTLLQLLVLLILCFYAFILPKLQIESSMVVGSSTVHETFSGQANWKSFIRSFSYKYVLY